MSSYIDPKRTRLPKLLKAMESDGLITSALQPGPLGPYRRIYEIGPTAESYLRENLKSSIETILHFYDIYRHENPQKLYSFSEEFHEQRRKGKILYAAFPFMKTNDLNCIRELLFSSEESSISIVGSDLILQKTGISYEVVGKDMTKLVSEKGTFVEIHIHGIPEVDQLPKAISECKRVLNRKGELRIVAPYAFFNEPVKPTLGEFIRITSSELFPELGVVEGERVYRVIKRYFPNAEIHETSLGEVIFQATKA
jgi:DNA-binding PadR family transcriptional regulator